jgi:hypothetical protein
MADDLGYTDVAAYGSKYYETPNIDRLAAQGMKFTNYHHCQNCTPTRAALMSGQYGARTGVYTVGGVERFDWSKRPLRPVDNVAELPLDRVENQPYAHYSKGSLAMYLLQDEIGEAAVNRALARFLAAHAFKAAPYPRSSDLIALFREDTWRSWGSDLHQKILLVFVHVRLILK